MLYVLDVFVNTEENGTFYKNATSVTFSNVAAMFSVICFFDEAKMKDEKAIQATAQIWVHRDPEDKIGHPTARAVKDLCFVLKAEYGKLLDFLVSECKGDMDQLAGLTIKRLLAAMQRSPIKYEEVESSIEIIILMSDEKTQEVPRLALEDKGHHNDIRCAHQVLQTTTYFCAREAGRDRCLFFLLFSLVKYRAFDPLDPRCREPRILRGVRKFLPFVYDCKRNDGQKHKGPIGKLLAKSVGVYVCRFRGCRSDESR